MLAAKCVESWKPTLMLQEDGLEATSPASPAEETWGVCQRKDNDGWGCSYQERCS